MGDTAIYLFLGPDCELAPSPRTLALARRRLEALASIHGPSGPLLVWPDSGSFGARLRKAWQSATLVPEAARNLSHGVDIAKLREDGVTRLDRDCCGTGGDGRRAPCALAKRIERPLRRQAPDLHHSGLSRRTLGLRYFPALRAGAQGVRRAALRFARAPYFERFVVTIFAIPSPPRAARACDKPCSAISMTSDPV